MKKLLIASSSIILAFGVSGAMASASQANLELGKATAKTAPAKMEPKLNQIIEDIVTNNGITVAYETTDYSGGDADYKGVKSLSCGNSSGGIVGCALELGKGSGCASNHTVWAVMYHGATVIDAYGDITGGDLAPVHFEYAVCNGTVVQNGVTGGKGTPSLSVTDCIADQDNDDVLTAAIQNQGVMQKAQDPNAFCTTYAATQLGSAS